MLLFPQSFLKSPAYGGMTSVALAAVISLTVLPAILGMLGSRVNKLAVGKRRKNPNADAEPGRGWHRFAEVVMKRPLLTAAPIIAVLLLLGAPFLRTDFGKPDERVAAAKRPGAAGHRTAPLRVSRDEQRQRSDRAPRATVGSGWARTGGLS